MLMEFTYPSLAPTSSCCDGSNGVEAQLLFSPQADEVAYGDHQIHIAGYEFIGAQQQSLHLRGKRNAT